MIKRLHFYSSMHTFINCFLPIIDAVRAILCSSIESFAKRHTTNLFFPLTIPDDDGDVYLNIITT
jgi:hypothetical protein